MRKKVVWFLVSCLVMLSLVLASCAPAVTEERKGITVREEKEAVVVKGEKEVVVVKKEIEMVQTSTGTMVEKPRYGGISVFLQNVTVRGMDQMTQIHSSVRTMQLTNDEFLIGDWAKSYGGTGQNTFLQTLYEPAYETGATVESFEIPDPDTIIFHVRQGIHFGLNPASEASRLVGGREMTAEDVAYTVRMAWSADFPRSWLGRNFPGWLQSAEVTAPWTVTIKASDEVFRTAAVWERLSDYLSVVPQEVIEKYGNLEDWKNSVGTGPFFLTDAVPASYYVLERNPNYYMMDPLHPDNQLPYLDGVKIMIVTDYSTRLAAMRTGKTDTLFWNTNLSADDAESLIQQHPEIQSIPVQKNAEIVFWNVNYEPFSDVRVRRALAMAVNNPEIVEDLFGGRAEMLVWPVAPLPEFGEAYTPVEELPESTRELYEYHPDKARQLLAEAGYPDGFKTEMRITAVNADKGSLLASYWAEVGVDVELKVMDTGALTSYVRAKRHTAIYYGGRGIATPYHFESVLPGHIYNYSVIDDPYFQERYPKLWKWENIGKNELRANILKEMTVHYLDQAYSMTFPSESTVNVWWPWLKAYHGESAVGLLSRNNFYRFLWLDQDLKKEMGY